MARTGSDDGNDDNDVGDKLVAPPDFDGPTSDRSCTDVLCSLLLICSWVAMSALGFYSVQNGDYRLVLNPLDYDGNVCGTTFGGKDMTGYPYLWYINSYGGGVCIKECPSLTNQVSDNLTDIRSMITYGGYWQTEGAELNDTFVQVANYSASDDAIFCSNDACFPNNSPKESYTSEGVSEGFGYAYYVIDSYPLLQRCLLNGESIDRIETLVEANNTATFPEDGYTFWNEVSAKAFCFSRSAIVSHLSSFNHLSLKAICRYLGRKSLYFRIWLWRGCGECIATTTHGMAIFSNNFPADR